MELGGSLPHSQEYTTCPYPSQINPFLCPSHFWLAQLVSFLVGLRTYQHPGTISTSVYGLVLLYELFIQTVGRTIQGTATTMLHWGQLYIKMHDTIKGQTLPNHKQGLPQGLGIILHENHRDFSVLPSASPSLSPPTLGSRYSFPDGKA